MKHISSAVNPTVKYYASLSRAPIRAREGLFVIEGDLLVRESLDAGITIVSAMADRTRISGVMQLIDEISAAGGEVYTADPAVLSKAGTLDTPQSIIALGRIPSARAEIKSDGRYIACEQIQNPGNAGAILRSAAAFGMDGALFCGGCDLYSTKVLRGSMGAVFKVPVFMYDSCEELAAALKKHGIRLAAAIVDGAARPVTEASLGAGSAVFIGNEGNGLTARARELCTEAVYIPMRADTESLNATVAASIFMWEMTK